MRRIALAAACAAALASTNECPAATLTSTRAQTLFGLQNWRTSIQASFPNQFNVHGANIPAPVTAGSSSISVSVDTVTDRLKYTDLDFIAPAMPAFTELHSFDYDFSVLETPANFPNPPVFKQYMGSYDVRVTYIAFVTTTPQFASSTEGTLFYSAGRDRFEATANITATLPTITLTGDYEIVGPQTTVADTFTIVYTPQRTSIRVSSAIAPDPALANGFPFIVASNRFERIEYSPNRNIQFGIVDDLLLSIDLIGDVNYLIPEPTSLTGLMTAMAIVVACARRRQPVSA